MKFKELYNLRFGISISSDTSKRRRQTKTAFSNSDGHLEFNRMSFGLKGAPTVSQRLMNVVYLD